MSHSRLYIKKKCNELSSCIFIVLYIQDSLFVITLGTPKLSNRLCVNYTILYNRINSEYRDQRVQQYLLFKIYIIFCITNRLDRPESTLLWRSVRGNINIKYPKALLFWRKQNAHLSVTTIHICPFCLFDANHEKAVEFVYILCWMWRLYSLYKYPFSLSFFSVLFSSSSSSYSYA